jgi:serine/threonine-protein kinase SRPK3
LVLKKLGWGAFSTVWFCHDLEQDKFVAIKIQKSGESYYSAAEDEIEILDLIAERWQEEEWREFLEEAQLGGNMNSCQCL